MTTKRHLLEKARQKGLRGVSRLRKDELFDLFENLPDEPDKVLAAREWRENEEDEKFKTKN